MEPTGLIFEIIKYLGGIGGAVYLALELKSLRKMIELKLDNLIKTHCLDCRNYEKR